MTTFQFTYSPEELPPPTELEEEMEASALLANALERMDGLIGDYKHPSPLPDVILTDPLAIAIVTESEKLESLIKQWMEKGEDPEGEERQDPRPVIAPETKEMLISWLGNKTFDTPLQSDQLQKDKEELLRQVVGLRGQLESCSVESKTLKSKVFGLEKKMVEKEQYCSSLSEELKAMRATLQAREAELKNLQDEVQASLRGNRGVTPPKLDKKHSKGRVTIKDTSGFEPLPRRNSFKRTLVKAFGRKKAHTATLNAGGLVGREAAPQPLNPRAAAFYALTAKQLASWFQRIGLEMYSDIVEHSISSGERLATMISSPTNDELVNVGILSTFHCKKLRLAVDEALCEYPTPLEQLDHHWVAEWLRSIGLPQYQRHFEEGRIDGRMLNFITSEELNLLEILTPFHVVSIKRAIQAFRMCGYDREYLSQTASDRGSMKLLHWSAEDVANWVRAIELDSYVSGLENSGIHGAVMLLDTQFTSESLGYVLGIGPSKALICKHLAKKFMELIGPVAAQKKLDAMQAKGFQALDPTEPPRHRGRSRSLGSRKGKHQNTGEEDLLCPLQDYPVIESSGRLGSTASSTTPPPEDVTSPDMETPPTP